VVQPLDTSAHGATDAVRITSGSTVKDVAEYLGVPVPEIIKQLMVMGEMATLTQTLSDEAIARRVQLRALNEAGREVLETHSRAFQSHRHALAVALAKWVAAHLSVFAT
jgi:hypothetical protein